VYHRALDVMRYGHEMYKEEPRAWHAIGTIFKANGVLQWAAFYILSTVLF
jgi:hypothetical protein